MTKFETNAKNWSVDKTSQRSAHIACLVFLEESLRRRRGSPPPRGGHPKTGQRQLRNMIPAIYAGATLSTDDGSAAMPPIIDNLAGSETAKVSSHPISAVDVVPLQCAAFPFTDGASGPEMRAQQGILCHPVPTSAYAPHPPAAARHAEVSAGCEHSRWLTTHPKMPASRETLLRHMHILGCPR